MKGRIKRAPNLELRNLVAGKEKGNVLYRVMFSLRRDETKFLRDVKFSIIHVGKYWPVFDFKNSIIG